MSELLAGIRKVLVTGPPGCGKTTLVENVIAAAPEGGLAGFVTAAVREGGRRVGFRMVPMAGEPRMIAHASFISNQRVGRYGVDVEAVSYAADLFLGRTAVANAGLVVIDEIGKMECFSKRFVSAVRRLIGADTPLIATIAAKGDGVIAELRDAALGRDDCALLSMEDHERDALGEMLTAWARPLWAGG